MNFDKEGHYFFFFFLGGGGGDYNRKKTKTIGIRLFFVLMVYIKFQVPCSSGSLVLTQTKEATDR